MKRKLTITLSLELDDIEPGNREKLARQVDMTPDELHNLAYHSTAEIANAFADQAVRHFNDIKSSYDLGEFLRYDNIYASIARWKIVDCKENSADEESSAA
ncbi:MULTISPECIES: hypothetical protein [Thalassospira]|uniref:hypothetical protein n=1 Tax=Thalassospira TaxID=168934 RepID=UPI0008DD9F95|nr:MULTISPECIES: hypothetical protein [Thalassospira]MDM7975190.1 hypothetical protein [Thalassospira xiamenensis]OHZ01023.1 hypothetical protein BC440_09305 [Thalassospira sp. MIT1004]